MNCADSDATSNRGAPDAARGPVRAVFPSKFSLCRIAGIFADAFSDYPLMRWALTDQSAPAQMSFQLFRLLVDEFGSEFGAIDLAEHDSGAAVWIRSGGLPQLSEETCGQLKKGSRNTWRSKHEETTFDQSLHGTVPSKYTAPILIFDRSANSPSETWTRDSTDAGWTENSGYRPDSGFHRNLFRERNPILPAIQL